jgi:hypothetical protein
MKYDHETSMKKRSKILSCSLTLELLASLTLGQMLDVDELDDLKNTRSLGNKSSALSFSQKLNLLLDIKTITKDERTKLDSFLGIRNQFMHNKSAFSYFTAVNAFNGMNKLLKFYPESLDKLEVEKALEGDEAALLNVEISLEKCTDELFSDGMNIITGIKGSLLEKLKMKIERDFYKKQYDEAAQILVMQGEKLGVDMSKFKKLSVFKDSPDE